jgi:hypothetical protein
MDLKDVNREFQGKTFLMLLPPKGKNPLSANARLVFSYLHYRRMYKKGSSLEKMAAFLGMAAHHGVKSGIEELRSLKLVELRDGWQWFAQEERPPIFARKGFIPVYVLRKSKGGCLTNIDNLILWVLRYLQQPKVRWKWPRNRSAVLANFVGVENRNVKRHIKKLRRLNLVSEKWQVNTWAIDPDWYRSPSQVEPAEPYVPQPETGDRRIDDLLNYLVLHLTSNGHDRNHAFELIETLIQSGHLNEIKNPIQMQRVKDKISITRALDFAFITAAILDVVQKKSDATPVLAPPIKSVEVAIPEEGLLLTQPENGDVLDLGEVLDLEALSNSDEDFDFLFEGVTDDMVA